jgi:phosphatidate cytidylyltransferase
MNETLTRALSGLLYISILISATLFLNSFLILFGILLLLSVYEFCGLIKINKIFPLLSSAALYLFCSYFFVNTVTNIVLLSIFLLSSLIALRFLFNLKKQEISTYEKYVYLFGYICISFILLTQLSCIAGAFNPKIIISLFVLIWVNDTMAYVIGKSMGKNKLFKSVSPKKTIEGFLGGLGFSIFMSVLLAQYYIEQSAFLWIIIALIVGIFGTLGDLIESKFKRIAGVKDSGRIMPGHGGILDRLDSIIFAGPFVFLFYQILNYVS